MPPNKACSVAIIFGKLKLKSTETDDENFAAKSGERHRPTNDNVAFPNKYAVVNARQLEIVTPRKINKSKVSEPRSKFTRARKIKLKTINGRTNIRISMKHELIV